MAETKHVLHCPQSKGTKRGNKKAGLEGGLSLYISNKYMKVVIMEKHQVFFWVSLHFIRG